MLTTRMMKMTGTLMMTHRTMTLRITTTHGNDNDNDVVTTMLLVAVTSIATTMVTRVMMGLLTSHRQCCLGVAADRAVLRGDDTTAPLSFRGTDSALETASQVPVLASQMSLPHCGPLVAGQVPAPRVATCDYSVCRRPRARVPRWQPVDEAVHLPRLSAMTVGCEHVL